MPDLNYETNLRVTSLEKKTAMRTVNSEKNTVVTTARIDKWLWASRIFKTRTIAADACKNGRVTKGGARLKASHIIKEGEVIDVRKPPITYSFRVLKTIEKRIGAKLVAEVLEDVTAPEQYELLELSRVSGFIDRARGTGRPTKKDRRALDEFNTPVFLDDYDDLP